ncbi:MAG: CIA30 family protein [Planctomycetes bacterium]|nr:CIA30 family protein [Planctomycetota bacterium]
MHEQGRCLARGRAPRAVFLAWAALAACGAARDPGGERVHAVVGVRVFFGGAGGEVLEDATVVVRGALIEAVGPASAVEVPQGAAVTAGRGRTLLPGLFDLHVHLGGPGARFDRPLRGDVVLHAEQAAACGVTALLDLNAPEMLIFSLRGAQRAGTLPGLPRIFAAGAAISAPGGHGGEGGFPCRVVRDESDAAAEVRALAALQADAVKIMFDGGGWGGEQPRPALDGQCVAALVAAAHEHGLKALVHAVDVESARAAVLAGADALAHFPLLVERFVDPRVLRPFLDAEWRAAQRSTRRVGYFRERWESALSGVLKLHRRGVPILPGTDAGTPATFHGEAMHRELAALVEAGVEPAAALGLATGAAARFLGLEGCAGAVRPGLEADLLLVEGNPTRRIDDLRRIVLVMRAGLVLDREVVALRTAQQDRCPPAFEPEGAGEPPRHVVLFDFEDPAGVLPRHALAGGAGAQRVRARAVLDFGAGDPTIFLRIEGEAAGSAPLGGAGVLLALDAAGAPCRDFPLFTGVRFRARSGAGSEYRVLVHSRAVRDDDHFGASFAAETEWRSYFIPCASMAQIGHGRRTRFDVSEVTGIGFVAAPGADGAFRLDIDDVQLYR